MSTDLTNQDMSETDGYYPLIQLAIEKGMSIESMERLFALQERHQANQAAVRWSEAIRGFQSEMQPVYKSKDVMNRNGQKMYSYADYDSDIMAAAQPLLNKYEITVTFSTCTEAIDMKGTDGKPFHRAVMHTTCHVRVGKHVEDTTVTLGLPQIPNANDAQCAGAALTYGQRYSFIAALNIRIVGRDKDAENLAGTISEKQAQAMAKLMESSGVPRRKFLDVYGVKAAEGETVMDVLQHFPANRYDEAMSQLLGYIKRKETNK